MSKERLYTGAFCRFCETWVPAGAMVCTRCLGVKTPVAFEAKGSFLSASALGLMGIGILKHTFWGHGPGSNAMIAGGIGWAMLAGAAVFLLRATVLFYRWRRSGPVMFTHRLEQIDE